MTLGMPLKSGEVILAQVQFTDTFEMKKRPAVVLFEEFDNVVIAGITSNPNMAGIPLTREEGMLKDSVIKVNYIFTIAKFMVERQLFTLTREKKRLFYDELIKRLEEFNG